jgi:TNF receptor-associated protein 1
MLKNLKFQNFSPLIGRSLVSSPPPFSSRVFSSRKHEFKAETKKLLQIVASSLYSDKEIFCRELISNASDSMEKLRHAHLSQPEVFPFVLDGEMEINLLTDAEKKTLTIIDKGIGMNDEEMISLLGTIAKSGSQAFLKEVDNNNKNIIGQFGVGFYSAFMVGDQVDVYSKSAKVGSKGYKWTSKGLGEYEIEECDEGCDIGTKIVIHLKDDCLSYADPLKLRSTITRYTNFIQFPIKLNGETVNTVKPLWTMEKSEITGDQHKEFYRFIASAWDDYRFVFQFKTDAPINISSLLYVPETHFEHLGMQRMDPGVNLYSRKILIQKGAKILPDYLRFIKGVIDSEDIPMNLSREILQDSQLIKKLGDVMTLKIIRFLSDEAKKDEEKYLKFFEKFGKFIKEGVCTSEEKEFDNLKELLRFSTTSSTDSSLAITSLASYVSRMQKDQKSIYYLISSDKKTAEESVYYSQFKRKNFEVLFLTEDIDEFVANRMESYKDFKFENIASSSVLRTESTMEEGDKNKLVEFFKKSLGNAVSDVSVSSLDEKFPALVTDFESPSIRRLVR